MGNRNAGKGMRPKIGYNYSNWNTGWNFINWNNQQKKKQMSKELSTEQKQLVDQMIQENEGKAKKGDTVVPVETKPNALVDGILEWGNQLNFDELKDNSVLLVK